jgi:ribosome maturation factor RimP
VSSPGIDRLLRHAQDFERFAGEVVDLVLKAPIGAAAAGQVAANRKKFRGTLRGEGGWRIVWRRAGGQAGRAREQEARAGARAGAGLRAG